MLRTLEIEGLFGSGLPLMDGCVRRGASRSDIFQSTEKPLRSIENIWGTFWVVRKGAGNVG